MPPPWLLKLFTSNLLPVSLTRKAASLIAQWISRQIRSTDQRFSNLAPLPPDQPSPSRLAVVDGCHGGIPFWDWILLRGGLWSVYFWPVVLQTTIRRAKVLSVASVLELDGYTYESMAESMMDSLAELREGLASGRLEIANGTYSQPFLQTISGESVLRQFFEGLTVIEATTGIRVISYASQEPCFCVQIPQILSGFGYQQALIRTHWAAFGTEPAFDFQLIRWSGPDGSGIDTVPRYSLMDYSRLMNDSLHPGILAGGLSVTPSGQLRLDELAEFQRRAVQRGLLRPLFTQFVDVTEGPTPMSILSSLQPTTLQEYVAAIRTTEQPQSVTLKQDDLPQTLPWGLEGDVLIRTRAEAEGLLLCAQQRDAKRWWDTGKTNAESLRKAWRSLLLAQHHDLQVCGTWLSRKHGVTMSAVGVDYCRKAQQLATNVLAECPDSGDSTPATPSTPILDATIDSQGTLSLTSDDELVLEHGAFFTVFYNGAMYDSRDDIQSVDSIEEGLWRIAGRVGSIQFEETITVGERIDVSVSFDFGTGMLFGPDEPLRGYYTDNQRKLCAVFPTSFSTVVRDSPYYFDVTQAENFGALSWVGLEDGHERGIALLSHSASGYHFDRATHTLRRVLAWAPKSWLYDSDDSITRNGSRFTPMKGKHTFKYSIVAYQNRTEMAALAWESMVPRPSWPRVSPRDVILSSLFVQQHQLCVRLWNPSPTHQTVDIDVGQEATIIKVNFRLEEPQPMRGTRLHMPPWGIQTLLIKRA